MALPTVRVRTLPALRDARTTRMLWMEGLLVSSMPKTYLAQLLWPPGDRGMGRGEIRVGL